MRTFLTTDFTPIFRAREWAIDKHGDQPYGDRPYKWHLDAVFTTLLRFEIYDQAILQGAYCHDVVEDKKATLQDVIDAFGTEVGYIVDHVTDRPGKNRTERHAQTYKRMRGEVKPTILKLGDRIANMEACIIHNPGLLKMYIKEYPAFRDVLYIEGMADHMWAYLDELYDRHKK